MFLTVRVCGSCSSLLAHGLQFVDEAAAKCMEWGFGSGELSSGAAGTLVTVLRRLVLLAVSLGASVPDSALHFRVLWRLHKSWLLAVPPEFRTFVDFKLALAAAVFATVPGENETPAGSRQSPARARRVSGGVSLCSGSGAQHDADFQAVPRRLGLINSPFTLAGFRGGGATDYFLRCRYAPALRRRGRWSSEKTVERYVQEGVYFLESLSFPTRAANLMAELSDLAPQVFHETATALFARLPPNTIDQRLETVVEVRHRAQWAGGESELYRGSVSQHLDLNS